MVFRTESEFEEAVIKLLMNKGWENTVLKNPTEDDLIQNWAQILYENNKGRDRLNNVPLSESEMQQIMEQIIELRTPLKLNGFINGKTVSITRDNTDDVLHFGKEVSLKIYDRQEIAAGQSRYQIAQQPRFKSKSAIQHDRRGDLMLLINGMPVIHIELKRSGTHVSDAYYQIEKYSKEGIFSGIFSLIQVFVAMEPNETVYFANPGPKGRFNPAFYFHWADFNNEPINNWQHVVSSLLHIPMAHQLIGFYTVADDADGILKVMRSYQYYAANAISDRVAKLNWSEKNLLGGYIWHTTGSGKTMTSFKSAQMIANSKDADKVIFLMDRIELGTQSLAEYRAFADDNEEVQATEDTRTLITKLKSNDPADTLIVTSIQKMSNIKTDEGGLNSADIEAMRDKRIVFIIDEAHRSTFGDMLATIKHTFCDAVFFGFTGTPIQKENEKKKNTTTSVFGNELHRYSLADGIRDGNVLAFDPYKVMTFKDKDLRKVVALEQAKSKDEIEAISDPRKSKVYYRWMDPGQVKMAGYIDNDGRYVKGIEDHLPPSQYREHEHHKIVVQDIIENWPTLSRVRQFHAIFATDSIPEAIEYYRLFKEQASGLNVTALFDPHIDNAEGAFSKEEGLIEILEDYNSLFGQEFTLATHAKFKKDVASRLAHKRPYERIHNNPEEQIDLLIVVDQMLTGFDSKWINTLYLDKLLEYERIIQAFSRTNRLYGPEKPFGTIRYYRYPHTMEENINKAVALYSGNKPLGLFVDQLPKNITKMNQIFSEISELFSNAGIDNFQHLPYDPREKAKFASLFNEFNDYLEAAKVQGFSWQKVKPLDNEVNEDIELHINENTYLILVLRYKELLAQGGGDNQPEEDGIPYEIKGHLTEIDTGRIDAEYMNSRFEKYLKVINQPGDNPVLEQQTLNELHQSFGFLSQEEQRFANIFLHDVQTGEILLEPGKSFRDYITEYQYENKKQQIEELINITGVDRRRLNEFLDDEVSETNLNEYGRFDKLLSTVDRVRAQEYFTKQHGKALPVFKLNVEITKLLKKFIFEGGIDLIEQANED